MDSAIKEGDRLYLIAERLAKEFDLFPSADPEAVFSVQGLLSADEIAREAAALDRLDIDSYIERVVSPGENTRRASASEIVSQLGEVRELTEEGPYLDAVLEVEFPNGIRPLGVVAQNRRERNGEWMPEHHRRAAQFVRGCSQRNIPIVSLMDTPGAAGDEIANRNNQAHQISLLIAEMSAVDVPNLGIIFGVGYSGGAIPLAASNMILSVRDGVFSTIQPQGLASIARRLNLSWQECAKQVGLSPFELMNQGNIDGIIDYVPGEEHKFNNLKKAIVTGIDSIEKSARAFVGSNPYIVEYHRQALTRYLEPSSRAKKRENFGELGGFGTPTEFSNVFGDALRYLRYLRVRRRIKAASKQQYGRLTTRRKTVGDLQSRVERERNRIYFRWLLDPDRLMYDTSLNSAWKNYIARKSGKDESRGTLLSLIRGEPRANFEAARQALLATYVSYLYNHWKVESAGNLALLHQNLSNAVDSAFYVTPSDIADVNQLMNAMTADNELMPTLMERFSYDGKKMFLRSTDWLHSYSQDQLRMQLSVELNLALVSGPLEEGANENPTSPIEANRRVLNERFGSHLRQPRELRVLGEEATDLSIVDVLLNEDLRRDFVEEIRNFQLFDVIYDELLGRLVQIAGQAQRTQSLDRQTVADLIDETFTAGLHQIEPDNELDEAALRERRDAFLDWFRQLSKTRLSKTFFATVEEWKKLIHTDLSDTLFVVVKEFFEGLLTTYVDSERGDGKFTGNIRPKNIGRRRDFWNRLQIAYRDLQIQETLNEYKRLRLTSHQAFIDRFFTEFEESGRDMLSSDPCDFPGFRESIEKALDKDEPPAGVVTGIGKFKLAKREVRVGAVISNPDFQAGAFDMASAEKFCTLLVRCAEQQLPVVCFISSGGMQTKEGAGALFSMAAINDRITRFICDFDLPVIVFGHGDCTGGAQASFVTHPLVHTHYFSGTSMPFAGQIVIPSHLPAESILANYLASNPESMQGLVKHPFYGELDTDLRAIDPDIPTPTATVEDAIATVLSDDYTFGTALPLSAPRHIDDQDLYRPVKRVLVHARGCAASKIVRIAQSQNIETVLVQSDPDVESVAADMLGPKDQLVSIGGSTPDESYLNARSVLVVAENEHVDALHPGIGFLSESSQFASLIRSHGINFVGPPVSSMETMGNKSNAIKSAIAFGVPVVPGSHGVVTDVDAAAEMAEEIGYPVLIKAVHGGGGKGIQVVESAASFYEAFQRVTVEARAAFGNGDVYLEKFVTKLRHIEAQVLRDSHGNTKVLGIRDCSVQRDKQKVIEESGSTMLPENLLEDVIKSSASIAGGVGYVGAGTVEFIYDLDSDAVYFMEMNTRLQVEHPVTELVSGVDIVAEQFRIAGGESIKELEVGSDGYAIEARINAERLVRDSEGELVLRPSAGEITKWDFPEDDDVEIISTAGQGKFISPYYDSMIMQVIAHGEDRESTSKKLVDYLNQVTLEGIYTNIPLLRTILTDKGFLDGIYDTGYLPNLLTNIDADALIEEIDDMAAVDAQAVGWDAIQIEDSDELRVLAPSTGIFYIKPTPGDPDYVNVNDVIGTDDVVCQLEAFKVFTPMRLRDINTVEQVFFSDSTRYRVNRINVATGQQVNAGDLLFVVEPVSKEPESTEN
ncbi:MAG: ATP-grasp domain-containing protein [Gammaproteobacteria bacterium]|nr:ATP-grasp domain-containing protein [Gammaproteobacteria bacterium]